MTEVSHWVDTHVERLSALAERLGVPDDVVHVASVLVLGGMPDDQIRALLHSVQWGGPDQNRSVAAVGRALPAIREAVTQDVWPGPDREGGGHRVAPYGADSPR